MRQAGVVAGDDDLGAGLGDVCRLVSAHGDGHVGVLHGEGAAEAAALVRSGELDEVDALDGPEKLQRPVPHPQQPERVAGRVVGHAVREPRPDVRDAEDVDEELGELVDSRRDLLDLARQALVASAPGDHRVLVADRADARPRRGDHRVVVPEHVDEATHERDGLTGIPRVRQHLAAAGLRGRELDSAPEPLEQAHRRLRRLRPHRVVEARGEERDPKIRARRRYHHGNIQARIVD